MEMERVREEMLGIYQERIGNYRKLISLAEEQNKILLGPGYAELPENLSQFDPIILAMKKLEKKEDSICEYLRKKQAAGDWIDFEPKDEKIRELGGCAMELALKLRKMTIVNAQLIDNLMKFINFSIGIVCKVATGGVQDGTRPALLLDMKV